MKKHNILWYFILLLTSINVAKAQEQEYILYKNSTGISHNNIDAKQMMKVTPGEDYYHAKTYYISNNRLATEGNYLDNFCLQADGPFKNYDENGVLLDSMLFKEGILIERTAFYTNGNKKSHYVKAHDKVPAVQLGWDEQGQPLPNYIAVQTPEFVGGIKGWQNFINKNLDIKVAMQPNIPLGIYTVKMDIWITKNGKPTQFIAIDSPEKCKPCLLEAIRVLKLSPAWQPAFFDGVAVDFPMLLSMSFNTTMAN